MVLTTAAAIGLLSNCSRAQETKIGAGRINGDKKVLIVYLSRTGNTRTIAEIIHAKVGGQIVALELETPYPIDYRSIVEQVVKENETGYLPPLKTNIDRIEHYDFVFVGFPTWGMRLPPPIKAFLTENHLKGKTVIPFNTTAGYGIGSTFETVRELCRECTVVEGFTTRGGIERDGQLLMIKGARDAEAKKEVEIWLRKIGILQQ